MSQPTHTFKFPARDVDSAKPEPYQLRLSLSPVRAAALCGTLGANFDAIKQQKYLARTLLSLETAMANKNDFTPEEWTKVLESIIAAGIAVSAVDPSGLVLRSRCKHPGAY